ncbi:MAG: phenylacetate-coenzyme A ligase [Planctomycetia bacterium]
MTYFAHEEETLDRDGIAALQRRKLTAMLREVLAQNSFYRARLGNRSAEELAEGFSALPLTTRSEIQQDQRDHPPFGTNLTFPIECYTRLHQTSATSGEPLRMVDRPEDWTWWKKCWGTIYRAASVTKADRFIFPFSFGPFIGFWAAFESAVELGNLCLPAGGMTTTARLRFLIENEVTMICCTPTYALRMAEVAKNEGIDIAASAVRGLIVAGEPGGSVPATRRAIETAWGARVYDHTGLTEVGPFGFECEEKPGGMHLMESEFIIEVIDPKSQQSTPDGEPGELVVTHLGRWGMPLIRYRTGDLVRLSRGKCACGRHFARVDEGILGRIDEMFFIRGNNVYPSQIDDIVRGIGGVAEYRLEVDARGAMTQLNIEIEPTLEGDGSLARRLESAVQNRLHFKPVVSLARPGSLPRFEMKARRLTKLT